MPTVATPDSVRSAHTSSHFGPASVAGTTAVRSYPAIEGTCALPKWGNIFQPRCISHLGEWVSGLGRFHLSPGVAKLSTQETHNYGVIRIAYMGPMTG